MRLGNDELAAAVPAHARTVIVPSIYYEGLFPYQANVHLPGERVAVPAPLTEYHDLRIIAAAARGLDAGDAAAFTLGHRAEDTVLEAIAEQSAERLRVRDAATDVEIATDFLELSKRTRTLHSVNHPSDTSLRLVTDGILRLLGLPNDSAPTPTDPLGSVSTPIEAQVVESQGLKTPVETSWRIHGEQVAWHTVAERHLNEYRTKPMALQAALKEHAERLSVLGLQV